MSGKAQIGPAAAVAGVEVGDRVAAILTAKNQPMTGEAKLLKLPCDNVERTLVARRYTRPANQFGGEGCRIEGGVSHSRKRSLIAVLARVCSSTVLTMTAQ